MTLGRSRRGPDVLRRAVRPLHRFMLRPSVRASSAFRGVQQLVHYLPQEEVLSKSMAFAASCGIPGDYLEFGVYAGDSFTAAYHFAAVNHIDGMRFYAFDSFEGMPPTTEESAGGSPEHREGGYACDRARFEEIIFASGVDPGRVEILDGWYDDILTADLRDKLPIDVAAMISADCGLYESTLIVISAKHGQSPIDSVRYLGISTTPNDPITTSPATILEDLLPPSESPANPNGIGPTEDDISLIWLTDSSQTASAVQMLETQSPATNNIAGIGEIFSGPGITQMFNPPGLPPSGDPRTPDIIVTPNVGVTYSGSGKKLAEHGGFSHDDTNVIMLLSNPSISPSTVTSPVETYQIAPTILAALGLDPNQLTAVRIEGTQVLPGLDLDTGKSH